MIKADVLGTSEVVEITTAITQVLLDRLGGRPILPSPEAHASEADLLGAVMAGDPDALAEVKSLSPLDFHDKFWQLVRVTMEGMGWERLSCDMVASVMSAANFVLDAGETAHRLHVASDNPAPAEFAAARVRRASKARKLATWLRRLEEDICLGRISADEAVAKMRKVTEKR